MKIRVVSENGFAMNRRHFLKLAGGLGGVALVPGLRSRELEQTPPSWWAPPRLPVLNGHGGAIKVCSGPNELPAEPFVDIDFHQGLIVLLCKVVAISRSQLLGRRELLRCGHRSNPGEIRLR